jgi:hypothetical protein
MHPSICSVQCDVRLGVTACLLIDILPQFFATRPAAFDALFFETVLGVNA